MESNIHCLWVLRSKRSNSTSDGGFALIGVSNYDPLYGTQDTVWLIKTDSQGNAIWNQTLGSGEPTSIIQTADNGFAIANDYNFQLLKSTLTETCK